MAIKFGITGLLIGLVLHLIWGNVQEIKYSVFTGFSIGFLIGFFDFLFHTRVLKKLPYAITLLLRTVFYFIIILICIYIFLLFYLKSKELGSEALSDLQALEEISAVYFLVNVNTLYLLILAMILSFLGQLKSFFGRHVLRDYLLGKYHKPRIEERIFMFLDLNDATTLAEKLGPEKYSALLQDFFRDIDEAIVQCKGHIFQYVGDEVVVIWKPISGLKNNNCVRSFFQALRRIATKKEYYLNTYQSIPLFKAALHIGEVSITEIGVSKKEIAYHGDMINTTARVCGSAHSLGKRILITKNLFERLPDKKDAIFTDLGAHALKGKDEDINLYSVGLDHI